MSRKHQGTAGRSRHAGCRPADRPIRSATLQRRAGRRTSAMRRIPTACCRRRDCLAARRRSCSTSPGVNRNLVQRSRPAVGQRTAAPSATCAADSTCSLAEPITLELVRARRFVARSTSVQPRGSNCSRRSSGPGQLLDFRRCEHQRHQVARLALGFAAGEGKPRAVEDAVQGVVVVRRDRIVLVVVAAGAADRQAQNALPSLSITSSCIRWMSLSMSWPKRRAMAGSRWR